MNSYIMITPVFLNNYFTATPESTTYFFDATEEQPAPDFCVTPNGVHHDLEIIPAIARRAQPGFVTRIDMVYRNNGNQPMSGNITVTFDNSTQAYNNAWPAGGTVSGNTVNFPFENLLPFESRTIILQFDVNSPTDTPAVNIDDILGYTITIASNQPEIADENPYDNTVSFGQLVTGSFDPNDKSVLEGEAISLEQAGEYLHYMVRFQNTGTAPAQFVRIEDFLDVKFDTATLQVVGGSHPFRMNLSGNKLVANFDDINLPAASVDEEGSQGYIAFKIKPKAGMGEGDYVDNTASIFFDYNAPIVTNTVTTTVVVLGTANPVFEQKFTVYPNPANDVINIASKNNAAIRTVNVYNALGQHLLNISAAPTTIITLSTATLQPGSYIISIATDKGIATQKFIKQ